ncbi:Toxin co-regulated pilus biosynthesis protein E, anchors TcpT to membrane (plasmid) [Cupriavidus necator H850]|uniref:pilus assembly protein TadE n=1 Tax=Cupriavidus necator TaxID=106590 RepID=UPI00129ED92E|nr:pilus assembly protein TadE [Cupriavidus necator]KAI3602976.1 Toxin co-regulated pilus biosynthesis protein E, anchors TcpT to membrane [Cupriavidus necator H850]
MLKGWMQRLSGVLARSIGGRVLRAGDRAFADKLFWAKYRFRDLRSNYYYDLAMRIEHMPGEPISNHFAKDAARRAGEPIGMLAAHWLARYEGVDGQMQHSRLTEVFRGTVPEEDIPILAVSEEGGDIKEGLLTLAKNLVALQAAKAGVIATLASVIAVLLILHVYLGVMAFVVGPQVDRSFASTLSVDDYGPLAAAYHVSTTWLRHWGWLVLLAEIALVAWVVRALPGYVGRWRNWLDNKVLVFDFFRRFQSAQFLAGMSAVTKRFGADARNLAQGLSLMRTNAYPYLGHHIERMELNLEYIPNEGGKIFDTGLFDRDTSYRIQDIAEYEGDLSKMLQTVSEHLLERAPKEMLARATRFNRRASVMLIVLMTALAYYPAFMAQELNAKSKLAAMSNKRPVQTVPQHQ